MFDKSTIKSFTDLVVWQESHKLCLMIYKLTASFPTTEQYGLTSQIRRACISVTSNIAEGFGRKTSADQEHFYTMASGSLYEVKNQIILSRDLGFVDKENFNAIEELANNSHMLLNGLLRAHRAKQASSINNQASKR